MGVGLSIERCSTVGGKDCQWGPAHQQSYVSYMVVLGGQVCSIHVRELIRVELYG